MMQSDHHHHLPKGKKHNGSKSKSKWVLAVGIILTILLLIFVIILILAFTIFKINEPRVQVLSLNIHGVDPSISFPMIQPELKVTFDLKIQVENPNHASFSHGAGKSLLIFRGNQVGEVNLEEGFIQAESSTIIPCNMSLTVNALSSNTRQLITDVQAGEVVIGTNTSIPGTVSFLGGLIKKKIVAASQCQLTIGFPDMKMLNKECKSHNML